MNFRNFLQQVYKKWKNFYYFVVLFIAGTLISAFLVSQTIAPFYIYSMYSYVFPPKSEMQGFKIIVNGQELNTFCFLKGTGDIVRGNVSRFIYLKNNNYKDKYYDKLKDKVGDKIPSLFYDRLFKYKNLDLDFLSWLKIFLQDQLEYNIRTIEIYSVDLKIGENFQPAPQNYQLVVLKKFSE